jgi:HEAT repeat protein
VRGDPAEEVRIAAAIELGKGDFSWGIDDLVRLALDASPRVRLAAVEALGHYAGARVYAAIIQRTGDDNAEVARAAEGVLRTWSETESLDYLLQATTDRDYRVRSSALRVLAGLRDSRIPAALLESARRDDNPVVRREAVRALGTLAWRPARLLLWEIKNTDAAAEVVSEAEQALAKIGGNVTDLSLAVLPPTGERTLGAVASLVRDHLNRELVGAHLADVVASELGPVKEGEELAAAALEVAKRLGVKQVIAGRLRRDANTITVTLYRFEVEGARLVQQEELVGYDDKAEELAQRLAKLFVQRFR